MTVGIALPQFSCRRFLRKGALRAILAGLFLSVSCALFTAESVAANHAVALIYHRFGEDAYPSTSIPIDQFETHLEELKSGDYTVLPLPEILKALREGTPLPERTVAITIDDAFLSVYTEAWPRLKAAGFPMTLFIATQVIDQGGKSYMTWDQVRELLRDGVTIGSQTDTHLHMPLVDAETVRADLAHSNARFREELGKAPALLAYPYGEASLAVQEITRKAGFEAAFGQHSGVLHGGEDFFYLPRFAFSKTYGSLERFRLAANALPLPVKDITPRDLVLGKGSNPPNFGFTIADDIPDLNRLRCYASGQGQAELGQLGERRFEVRLAAPFPKGRARINCTLHTRDGHWRWYGRQFYVTE